MQRVAWRSMTDKGPGRSSINHYTSDNKLTFCNKKIPQNAFCYDAFGPTDCIKCLEKKDEVNVFKMNWDEKVIFFRETVTLLGGTYQLEDGEHKAWWDAYGDNKNICIAYGKLSGIGVCMLNNWLYLSRNHE